MSCSPPRANRREPRYSPRTKGKANAPSAKPDDNDVPLADSEFKQQETAETAEALAAKKVPKKKVPKKSAKAARTPAEVKKAAEVAAVAANDMYYITQQQQQWYRSEKPTLMSGLCTDVIKLADGSDDIYGVHAKDHVYPMYVGALSQTVKGPSGSAAWAVKLAEMAHEYSSHIYSKEGHPLHDEAVDSHSAFEVATAAHNKVDKLEVKMKIIQESIEKLELEILSAKQQSALKQQLAKVAKLKQQLIPLESAKSDSAAAAFELAKLLRPDVGLLILLFTSVLSTPTAIVEEWMDKAKSSEEGKRPEEPFEPLEWNRGPVIAYLYDPASDLIRQTPKGETPPVMLQRFPNAQEAIDWAWNGDDGGAEPRGIWKCAVLGYNMLQAGLTLQHTHRRNSEIPGDHTRRYCPRHFATSISNNAPLDSTLQLVGRAFVDFKDVCVPDKWSIELLGEETLIKRLSLYSKSELHLAKVPSGLATYSAIKQAFWPKGKDQVLTASVFELLCLGTVGRRHASFGELLGIRSQNPVVEAIPAIKPDDPMEVDPPEAGSVAKGLPMDVSTASASQWGNHPWVMEGRVSQLASLMASVARISGAARS